MLDLAQTTALGLASKTHTFWTLQNVGEIAAIVGGGIASVVFVAGIVRWWHRGHHSIRGVRVVMIEHGHPAQRILRVLGLPAWTDGVTIFVKDGNGLQKRLARDL